MRSWFAPAVPVLPGRGPDPLIWDTASGGLAVAAAGPGAALYACGITPYDATHLGHAATYVAWDLLIRAWLDAGLDVRYVQNVTDVDDPLLERAARDAEDWAVLAAREIERFRSDMTALRVLSPDHLVGAVEAVGVITEFSLRLADRGALYELEGDSYFARLADPWFGSVSRLDQATMTVLSAERGGDPARPGKKDPLDPVVWRAERTGEPSWDSPFGPGRPGWHVECAAIATRYLGVAFDVQAGGSDLIFPHHEMSASHARVALAGPDDAGPAQPAVFARRYAHAGMVRLDGEKMSKSLGNLVFVSRLLAEGTDPMAIRLAILAHHYREDWDWTDEGLAAASGRLRRWRAAIAAVVAAEAAVAAGPAETAGAAVLARVRERLAEDLDAPGALAAIDRWADAVLAAAADGGSRPAGDGPGPPDAALVLGAADALLGIAL
jgi:L-cysteine:1D-myo-inositol 2-amino-2-deoxy-alpha-D-glucopyranoside ligase